MRGRYVVRVTPEDVGRRVSIRFRTHARQEEPSLTDAVGVLRSWAEGRLTVERRDGTVAVVPEEDLVAGRCVGDPPQRRRPPR